MAAPKLKIDEEFKSLCPPLSADEKAHLEDSLKKEGCRDAPVVWKGKGIILDGNNRYEICTKNNIDLPEPRELEFDDREAAKRWVVANQLSRRNLTAEAASYLRGVRYNAEKKPVSPGRPAKGDQSERVKTDERLGEEFKVGAATIRRDGLFASYVDAIAKNCGDKVRALILTRDRRITRGGVARLAKMKLDEQKAAVRHLEKEGQLPRNESKARRTKTVRLPRSPEAFAATVLEKFGPQKSAELVKALSEALKESKKTQKEAPASNKAE